MHKILITTGIYPPDIGGPASYAPTIAEHLSQHFDVSVLTYSAVWRHQADKAKPFKVIRVWKKIPRFIRHVLYLFCALNQVRNHDIVFSLNAVSAGVPALLAVRFFKRKFVVKVVGDYAWEMAINSNRTTLLINDFQKTNRTGWPGILHRLQIWVCRNASRIIVPSEYLAEIVTGWGIEREKITVIYNGVDFAPLTMTKEEARKHIGIPGNIITSIGRMVPWKGFRMLIKIMPQLLQVNQFFRLVIVGDGPEYSTLQSMIKNLGLDRKVYLVGKKNREDLALYLAATDIFVLNTGYEGFSHQILEAFSAGVPVITTAVGGNREIIEQGENGFMVKYNDEFNLIEAIKTLWRVPELREKFSENGKKTIKDFDVEAMLNETEKLIESL